MKTGKIIFLESMDEVAAAIRTVGDPEKLRLDIDTGDAGTTLGGELAFCSRDGVSEVADVYAIADDSSLRGGGGPSNIDNLDVAEWVCGLAGLEPGSVIIRN